jgi:uncharacterized protein (DUF934 family)
MAKKTRKVRQQESAQRAIRQAVNNTQSVAINPVVAPSAPAMTNRPPGAKVAPINPADEYKYVASDLRRIALLAVSFTLILIALSFVIK